MNKETDPKLKCQSCQSENIEFGKLTSSYGVPGFMPEGMIMWVIPYKLSAAVCMDCGHVQFIMSKTVRDELAKKLSKKRK